MTDNILPGSTWEEDDSERAVFKRATAENHAQVFTMWEQGIRDFEEIAIETDYSVNYVKQLLRARGFDISTVPTRSPEEVSVMIQDYEEGMGMRQLLKKHNISNNAFYNILDIKGIALRREKGSGIKSQLLDRAVEMYQEGETVKRITTETGVVPSVLYGELEERGVEMRNRPDLQSTVVERAVGLYIEGAKIDDIAVETGVTTARLYLELERRNIPVRRAGGFAERMEQAVGLYERGADIATIYQDTKIGSQQLYKELRHRGIEFRNGKRSKGANVPLALDLYDKGESFATISRQSRITLSEMVDQLVRRGTPLRTGLPPRKIKASLDIAITEYEAGEPEENITIDTLVTKVQLLAALHERGLAIRP